MYFKKHVFYLYVHGPISCISFNFKRVEIKVVVDIQTISNGHKTEWSTIQGVIGRVISNRPSA